MQKTGWTRETLASGQSGPYGPECPACGVVKTRAIVALPLWLNPEWREAVQSATQSGDRREAQLAWSTLAAPNPVMLVNEWTACECDAREPYPLAFGPTVEAALRWSVRFEPRSLDPYTWRGEIAARVFDDLTRERERIGRIKAAIGRANRAADEWRKVRPASEAAYTTALKRARLYRLACRDAAPQDKIDAMQATIRAEWEPRVKEAKRRIEGYKRAVEILADLIGDSGRDETCEP